MRAGGRRDSNAKAKKKVGTATELADPTMSYMEEAGPEPQSESLTKSRSSAVLRATKSAKPSSAVQPTPKKALKKSFATQNTRKSRKDPDGIGPGQYDQSKGLSATKARIPSAQISKTGRPDINRRTITAADDLGPGAYERNDEFGKNVKGLGFGKPKPEKKIFDDRDYNADNDKTFKQTRYRSPSATINKNTAARPSSFANQS